MSTFDSFFSDTAFTSTGCTLEEQTKFAEYLQGENMSETVSEAFATIMCRQFNATQTEVDSWSETAASLDGSFMLANTYLVFFMQAGFAMLCAGSVRTKNYMNILLKNVLDACFGAPVFYLIGYGLAYGVGTPSNKFIGNNDFALEDFTDWNGFIFQWAFAAATATIVSGSVAERCTFHAYISYSTLLTGFVYPVVVHWVWCSEGWLTAFSKDSYATNKDDLLLNTGMIDFAGSGVVHMTGGFAGLMGAYFIGPRLGRFSPSGPSPDFQGHSNTLVVLGTFVLWFGWYGFNPGSQLAISTANDLTIVGRAAVTTTLSGSCAGVAALFIAKYRDGIWDLAAVCNGVLAGLVGITAGCSVVEPAAAILCGVVSAFIFSGMCSLLLYLKIDDPLSASPMHGFCGMFGVFYVGLMAKQQYVEQVYGRDSSDNTPYGLFYGGGGELLGCQITGIVSIVSWTCGIIGPFFFAMNKMGFLRVDREEESMGLDESHHGGNEFFKKDAQAVVEMKQGIAAIEAE